MCVSAKGLICVHICSKSNLYVVLISLLFAKLTVLYNVEICAR